MSEREREEFEQERIAADMASTHNLKMKELELEVAKLEAKFSSWLKLPLYILMLPVKLLLGIAVIFSVFSKKDLPDRVWEILSK